MYYRVINRIRYGVILFIVFLACGATSLSTSSDVYRKARVVMQQL